jgi:hypothetical protein
MVKMKKINKRQNRAFLRWRVKWALLHTGLRMPFGGYITKGEFLKHLETLMEQHPEITRYKEEYDCYKNQPAPLDQNIFKIEADDKYMGTEWRPMFFQEYIGTDEEWVSPERRKAYEDWKATNSAVIEKELFRILDEKIPEAVSIPKDLIFGEESSDDTTEEPFDAEECMTVDEGTRAMTAQEMEE